MFDCILADCIIWEGGLTLFIFESLMVWQNAGHTAKLK